jgi:hypothetical protein
MESPFIKLSGARPQGLMGLMMDEGVPFRNAGGQYLFLEIPMRPILTDKGNPRKVIKAGELVYLQAACTLEPKQAHVDVVLNGELETTGYCGYQHRVEQGDTVEISVTYIPFNDIAINDIMADEWFVRLYATD